MNSFLHLDRQRSIRERNNSNTSEKDTERKKQSYFDHTLPQQRKGFCFIPQLPTTIHAAHIPLSSVCSNTEGSPGTSSGPAAALGLSVTTETIALTKNFFFYYCYSLGWSGTLVVLTSVCNTALHKEIVLCPDTLIWEQDRPIRNLSKTFDYFW